MSHRRHHNNDHHKHRRHLGRSFAGWAGDKLSLLLYYLPYWGHRQAKYITGKELAERLDKEQKNNR